jgi:hypothetical protein
MKVCQTGEKIQEREKGRLRLSHVQRQGAEERGESGQWPQWWAVAIIPRALSSHKSGLRTPNEPVHFPLEV